MKIKRIIIGLVAVAALAYGGWEAVKWTTMRVYVGPDEALVVVNKFGQPLPPNVVVVPTGEERYKGIRQEVLGPGRYFFDPVEYSWNIVSQIQIPAGDPQSWRWEHDGNLSDPTIAPGDDA